MKKRIQTILVFIILLAGSKSNGQGCVAVRPMGCAVGGSAENNGLLMKKQFQVSASYRYFESYKHFKGDTEQVERVIDKTNVINISHSVDLGVTYGLSSCFSVAINLPVIYFDRSSLYEHYGNSTTTNPDQLRFNTGSKGIGDLRLSGYYWLFNPHNDSLKGNISFGAALKAPTGNSNVLGDFHKISSEGTDSLVNKAVDQSIQLGDGGWGFNLEISGFKKLFKNCWGYYNGFYLFNPQNYNSTITRGTLVNVDPIIAYHSIADQFAGRIGLNYTLLPKHGISLSLGARAEGVPSHDLIGESDGFRRPGYIISSEPGLSWNHKKLFCSLNAPVALYRNRTKSVYDLADPSGLRHGDAAFADYLINLSLRYQFGGMKH